MPDISVMTICLQHVEQRLLAPDSLPEQAG